MIEDYFIFVIPDDTGTGNSDLIGFEWKEIGITEGKYYSLFPTYTEFKKKFHRDGQSFDVVLRRYSELCSNIFIIKSFNPFGIDEIRREIPEKVDSLFLEIITELGLSIYLGTRNLEAFSLRNYKCSEEFIKDKSGFIPIFHEGDDENIILCEDRFHYYTNLNSISRVSGKVIKDIIILLSLSKLGSSFLDYAERDKKRRKNILDLIKLLHKEKIELCNCPASLLFPSLFKNEITIIDNLMDYRNIELLDFQRELVQHQVDLQQRASRMELLILILTLILTFDILFRLLVDYTDISNKMIFYYCLSIFSYIIIIAILRADP